MDVSTTTVMIADKTGHTTLQLTQQETVDKVAGLEGAWVFAGDRMVQPAELAETNWDTVGTVRIVPGLVGGECPPKQPAIRLLLNYVRCHAAKWGMAAWLPHPPMGPSQCVLPCYRTANRARRRAALATHWRERSPRATTGR